MDHSSPTPRQIRAQRETLRVSLKMNINQARVWCASACLSSVDDFLCWESGRLDMHPAIFQILAVKVTLLDSELLSVNSNITASRFDIAMNQIDSYGNRKPQPKPRAARMVKPK